MLTKKKETLFFLEVTTYLQYSRKKRKQKKSIGKQMNKKRVNTGKEQTKK